MLTRYTQGDAVDEPLAELRNGNVAYYEQDGIGSVTSMTNSSSVTVNTYSYDIFGNVLASTVGVPNPFEYTGREYDQETSLNYYCARYYDSSTGRFLSEDPMRFGAGTNFYPYAGNGPASFVHPSGLQKRNPIPGGSSGKPFLVPKPPTNPTSVLGRILGVLGDLIEAGAENLTVILAIEGSAGGSDELEYERKCKEKQKLLDSGYCQVGRWMSPEELAGMQESGLVQESRLNGVTSVSVPPNAGSYKDATKGSVFVTFIVPCNRVKKIPGGWGKIYGPNSTIGRGLGVTDMPPAYFIEGPFLVK